MSDEVILLKERIKELEGENAVLKLQKIEITQAKNLYLKIFEEFPALIWRARLDKLCDYFNKTWLDFTGRTMEQEFGNGWAENVHPDDFDFCLQTYVAAFDKRESFMMEYRMKNNQGEYRWISDFGRPFHDLDETFLGYIGSCYDITERKQSEIIIAQQNQELQKLIADKDRFMSILAHDLKGPFLTLLTFSKLLADNAQNYDVSKIERYANHINNSAQNTLHLLEDLLSWSRTQTGKLPFTPQTLNFTEIYAETLNILKLSADEKCIKINFSGTEEIPIFADKEMLKTILRNLIANAIKFTEKGGQIEISTEQTPSEYMVFVSDNGIGLNPEELSKILDITQTYTNTGTAGEKGTGLGLLLCIEFIGKHGGNLTVESEEGKGSTFKFALPKQHETAKK